MTPTFNLRQQATQPLVCPALSAGFVDIDETLVFNYQLKPRQIVTGLQQPISRDGDFWLCGISMSCVEFQRPDLIEVAALAGLRISDDTGYQLMNNFVNSNFFSPAFGNSYPYVINPIHMFKAGTRINIDLQELSGGGTDENPFLGNIVQILFRGRYRYRLSDVQAQTALIAQAKRFKSGSR